MHLKKKIGDIIKRNNIKFKKLNIIYNCFENFKWKANIKDYIKTFSQI